MPALNTTLFDRHLEDNKKHKKETSGNFVNDLFKRGVSLGSRRWGRTGGLYE